MDSQVFNVIAKVHAILKEKGDGGSLDTVELAYITGLLEAALEIFGEPVPISAQERLVNPDRPWYKKLLGE